MLRNILLVVLGVSAISAENTTYYLEDHCQQLNDLIVEDTITIRLTRDGQTTGEACKTHLGFHTTGDVSLLVSISKFNLTQTEPTGVCLKHFLQIGGLVNEYQQQRMCDNLEPKHFNHYMLSTEKKTDKHMYYFRTVPLDKNHTIELTVSPVAYADLEGRCPTLTNKKNASAAFRCEGDNLCIPDVLRCDKVPNCADYSDERDCQGTTTTTPTPTTSTSTVASLNPIVDIALDANARDTKNSKKPHIIIGVTGGVVILILVAVIALFLVRRNKRQYRSVTTEHVVVKPIEEADTEEINTNLKQPEDSTV